MMGISGLRMLVTSAKGTVKGAQNVLSVEFPQKTTVTSAQLVDHLGRPTYRKDIHV